MQRLKPIKIVRSKERISNRIGLPLIWEIINRLELPKQIDELFGRPGSNKGIKASNYVLTLLNMFIDGAIHLEDVRHLQTDQAYQEMLKGLRLPGSDAIGDWLRRYGGKDSEAWLMEVNSRIMSATEKPGKILDIDATIIKSDKGDSKKSYKGINGYQPMLGIIEENGLVASSEFRQGNQSPQSGLLEFVKKCRSNYPQEIKILRSDSAGWQKSLVDYCNQEGLNYTITAGQTTSVIKAISEIDESSWERGYSRDGIKEDYEVGETIYHFGAKRREVRLVVKRKRLTTQLDLFGNYSYWIVGTNLTEEQYSKQAIIHLHQNRGNMERRLGEIKHQINLGHMPTGQFRANTLYFTIGVLAYNLLQILKHLALPKSEQNKSVRALRYQLIKLAGKLVLHAREMILQIAAPIYNIKLFETAYTRLRLSPY